MARSVDTIYEEYYVTLQNESALGDLVPQADDAQTLLTDITTPSKVADHRILIRVFSFFSWMLEVLFDAHKAETTAIANANKYGTEPWWEQELKKFQYGFALTFVNNFPAYIDTTSAGALAAQVVKRAAAVSLGNGVVLLKVATADSAITTELTAIQQYCNMKKPAGITANVISLNADRLRLTTAKVKYNPLVLNPDGSLISAPSTFPVEDAINAYLLSIPFNGTFSINAMVDAVQAVEGIEDFQVDLAEYRVGVNPYAAISWTYQTVAGWMVEDSTPGNTFSDTITYEVA
ncbi:MAG: hypothetical protein AB7G44_05000 [Bacteroidia bacterium]